jgi:hypothetical protein
VASNFGQFAHEFQAGIFSILQDCRAVFSMIKLLRDLPMFFWSTRFDMSVAVKFISLSSICKMTIWQNQD